MEGLDHTNLYWVRVFLASLCLFDLLICLSVCVFHPYSTLNATFKNLKDFSVLWKFGEGGGVRGYTVMHGKWIEGTAYRV